MKKPRWIGSNGFTFYDVDMGRRAELIFLQKNRWPVFLSLYVVFNRITVSIVIYPVLEKSPVVDKTLIFYI